MSTQPYTGPNLSKLNEPVICRICNSPTHEIGSKRGKFRKQLFHLRRCAKCNFAFVSNPWTDYEDIYSEKYYLGEGPDPLIRYVFELDSPAETIRTCEWRGIRTLIGSLVRLERSMKWLDFGCGNGGLVRYCHDACDIVGYDNGWIVNKAIEAGIPVLQEEELHRLNGCFDIVTAIEVLEHVKDPLATLSRIHKLLKPGGLFFYTTGNARPHRGRLPSWSYVVPEVHISFFEPATLWEALSKTGFQPEHRGYLPGYTDMIRFRILKNLGLHRRAAWHSAIPWNVVARTIDWKLRVTAHPIAWAR